MYQNAWGVGPSPQTASGQASMALPSMSIAAPNWPQRFLLAIASTRGVLPGASGVATARFRRVPSPDVSPRRASSHHRDLHVVDGRQRFEQAVPFLAALASDPELAGRGPEVERRRLEAVDVHRVALDREIALLLRQALREPAPRAAAVLAAPHGG